MATAAARIERFFTLPFGVVADGLVVAYALWTITVNLVVIAGGKPSALMAASALLLAVLIGLIALGLLRPALVQAYLADAAADPVLAPRRPAWAALLGMLGLPALTLLVWLITGNPWFAWGGLALSAAYAAFDALREPCAMEQGESRAHLDALERRVLYALALFGALFAALAMRPRSDDTFYLNMAVSVVDYPEQALLSLKNLHGPASDTLGLQKMFAPYRVHSFEVLGGLISKLTGIEAVRVIHLGFAPVLAWFAPFAIARLLRLLAPRHWLVALFAVVVFYCVEGTASRGYANHAFVRMFNGKSALLTLGVPLICAYGLRFGARPSPARFALLALAQVAAVGLSSTALWLAPTLATIAVAAGTPALRQWPKSLAAGFASSAYVLALALWVMGQLGVSGEPLDADTRADTEPVAAATEVPPRFVEIAEAIPVVLGVPRTAVALLGVVLAAAAFAPNVLGLRLFALLAFVVAVGFGNPWLARAIAHYVTGVTTYQRIFWLLPVASAVGVVGAALYAWLSRRFAPAAARALAAIGLAAFLLLATQRLVISEANQARLTFPPALKLWTHARAGALEACRWAPHGKYVLAGNAVSLQLPIVHNCGYPIATDDRWLTASESEKAERDELVRYVGEHGDIAAERASWFISELSRYHIDVIVLSREAVHNARIKSLIRVAGFERVAGVDWDIVFARMRPERFLELAEVGRQVCRFVTPDRAVIAPFHVAAAVAQRGCARVLTTPTAALAASGSDFDALLQLERALYFAGDLSRAERAEIAAAIERLGVGTVVVSTQGKGNRRLRATLNKLKFEPVRSPRGYSILVRAPAAAE